MDRLFESLRRADAQLLHLLTTLLSTTDTKGGASSEPRASSSGWAPHVAALGAGLVLLAALLLQGHELPQLALVAAGLLMTAPFLQDTFDKATTWAKEES